MADMTATLGMDDAEFRRGITQLSSQSTAAASRFERDWGRASNEVRRMMMSSFGIEVGKRMAGTVRDLVTEYGKLNDVVGRANREIAGGGQTLLLPVMRGLSTWVLNAGDGFDVMERKAVGAYESIVNAYSDFLRVGMTLDAKGSIGNAAGVDQAMAIMEKQTRAAAALRALPGANMGVDAAIAAASGDQTGAEMLTEKMRHAKEIASLQEATNRFGLQGLAELVAKENQLHELRLAHIREQGEARAADAARGMGGGAVAQFREIEAGQKAADAAMRALNLEEARMSIEVKRLQGLDQEATIDQIRLDRAERLHDIAQNTAMSERERAMWATWIADKYGELEAATMDRARLDAEAGEAGGWAKSMPSRTLGAGMGPELSRQVFGSAGSSPTDGVLRDTSVNTKRAVEVLGRIERLLERPVVAVYS